MVRSGKNILTLDVGTTAIKAIVFDEYENVLAKANQPLTKRFPKTGWVEQTPADFLTISRRVLKEVVKQNHVEVQGLGITNQRETIVAWRKDTGAPLYPAIVWQDTRTKDWCANVAPEVNQKVREATGLPIDPYFSATKIKWLLDNVPEVKDALADKMLAIGTIDSWLMWNLLEDEPHITDETNAARTLLFNIKKREWDDELLNIFDIPLEVLPMIQRTQSSFGKLKMDIVDRAVPLVAVCGDQQASMYAAGLTKGTTKVTYGTGTFIMQIVGSELAVRDPFFTTLVPSGEEPIYAIEAKIDRGGPAVEPLLGDKTKLEAFLRDLVKDVDVYIKQLPITPKVIVIDGGVTRDDILARIQPEVTGIPVRQNAVFDGTSLGVARLAAENS